MGTKWVRDMTYRQMDHHVIRQTNGPSDRRSQNPRTQLQICVRWADGETDLISDYMLRGRPQKRAIIRIQATGSCIADMTSLDMSQFNGFQETRQ